MMSSDGSVAPARRAHVEGVGCWFEIAIGDAPIDDPCLFSLFIQKGSDLVRQSMSRIGQAASCHS
jgi:hypothetical protein